MSRHERESQLAADALRDYLATGPEPETLGGRSRARAALCAPAGRLLGAFLAEDRGWNRYEWIDGVLPEDIGTAGTSTVTIAGDAVLGERQTVRPVLITLRLGPEASTLRLAGDRDEQPLTRRGRWVWSGSAPEWRFEYEVQLPAPTV